MPYVDNSQLLLYKMLYDLDLWNDPNPFSGIYTNLEWGIEEREALNHDTYVASQYVKEDIGSSDGNYLLYTSYCLVVSAIISAEHVDSGSLHLLLFGLLLGSLLGSGSSAASTAAAGSGELAGVLEVLLVGLGLVEGVVVEADGDGEDDLEGVRNGVGDGGLGGVSDGEGEGGQSLEGLTELGGKDIVGDVEDLGVKEGAVVVDGLELKTVGEGRDLELLEESGLRGGNLVSLVNELDVVDDLNLTTGNLGGDLEGLEESGLTGITAGGALGDNDVAGGSGTDTGGGGTDVLLEDVTDVAEVAVGEDEADVAAEDLDKGLLRGIGVLLDELPQDLAHHGVLAHEDLALATETDTGLLELVGSDVVDLDDEALGVSAKHLLHAVEVLGLAFG